LEAARRSRCRARRNLGRPLRGRPPPPLTPHPCTHVEWPVRRTRMSSNGGHCQVEQVMESAPLTSWPGAPRPASGVSQDPLAGTRHRELGPGGARSRWTGPIPLYASHCRWIRGASGAGLSCSRLTTCLSWPPIMTQSRGLFCPTVGVRKRDARTSGWTKQWEQATHLSMSQFDLRAWHARNLSAVSTNRPGFSVVKEWATPFMIVNFAPLILS
jgi:hypothetical protein